MAVVISMFDQLPGERGFDFVPTTTSLLFTVAPGLALASIDGLPALPYDTVDMAMKAASTVSMPVAQDMDGLLTLQRTLGAALQAAGLGVHLAPPAMLLGEGQYPCTLPIREFALVQCLPERDRYVPLGQWSLDDR
ncbi:MAG: hypothetical protein LCH93_18505 [Proteobacteria bacterium]|nr:hypothetical protein [Pseudomonadota bacterium]